MGFTFNESQFFEFIIFLSCFIFGIIAYYKYKLMYWAKIGLPTLSPTFPYGDTKNLIFGRCTIGNQLLDIYKTCKEKGYRHVGIYVGFKPIYLPTDPEIIKHILQKDFQHFVNHAHYTNEKDDPLNAQLEDEKWKIMRKKLSPIFTANRMKMLFQTLVDCAEGLQDLVVKAENSRTPIEVKEVTARFTTDTISSIAFGLECNSLQNPEAPFRKYGKLIFQMGTIERLKILAQLVVPHSILRLIRFKATKPEVEDFVLNTVRKIIEYREKNNIYRKDVMHLLIQLKNRGFMTDDGKITDDHGKAEERGLNINEIAAQAYLFLFAGFEPASLTLTFALFELAINPHIQDKLREEIRTVLGKYNNVLTYEAAMEMTYMKQVLYETLRKYPSLPFLTRKCTLDYTIPNTSIVLKKNTSICISVSALHLDPEYYPNPEKFDPDRFSDENKNSIRPFTWLPFGDGPRICIGLRFGMLQTKVGLITFLKNHTIKLNKKTILPLEFDKKTFTTSTTGGIWLDVEQLS